MENASKALLMAGEILLGVLLLSLFVYVFASFANTTEIMEKQYSAEEIEKINSKFTSQNNKKMTVQELLTIVHAAQKFNEEFDGDAASNNNKYKIKVVITSGEIDCRNKDLTSLTDDELTEIVQENLLAVHQQSEGKKTTRKWFEIIKIEYNEKTDIVNSIEVQYSLSDADLIE